MFIVKVQYVIPVHLRIVRMSSDQEEALHMIDAGEGICRVEESPFLEVEKPTMGSLQLMKRLKT